MEDSQVKIREAKEESQIKESAKQIRDKKQDIKFDVRDYPINYLVSQYEKQEFYIPLREYYTVDRELSVDYFKNFLKRSTSYKELQNEIGEPNGELINDEFVYEITQGANEKTYITCEVLGDEIIKLEVCNEEKVIETIYEKNSEEN